MRTFSLLGALATLSGAVDVANAACRAGWTKSGTSCFRLFPENHNYQSAVWTCDAESANVAIIESKEQNDVVAGFLSSGEAFIGLTWSDRYSDFEWSDGNDLRYEASWWRKDTRNGGHYCTTVVSATGHWHASGWVNRPCSESKPVVCSMQAHVPRPAKTCLPGWKKARGACFRLFSAPHDYRSAAAACRAHSATLAVIKSQKQNALVAGLRFRGEAFIGLTWSDWQSTFKWSDGTAPTYEAVWYRKSTRNGGHSCTTMVSASGNWHPSEWVNRPCSQSKPFVCSMKARRYNIGLHDIVV